MTDGWYTIMVTLDATIAQAFRCGKLKSGDKLAIGVVEVSGSCIVYAVDESSILMCLHLYSV
jgi:hypothetical protein